MLKLARLTTDICPQKYEYEREELCKGFERMTRSWALSNDPEASDSREVQAKRLRAQYFKLDPYIRGRGGEQYSCGACLLTHHQSLCTH